MNTRPARVRGVLALLVISSLLAGVHSALPGYAASVQFERIQLERPGHALAVLGDGSVLLTGGRTRAGVVAKSEVLDALEVEVAAGPTLTVARAGHTATPLLDGRVLVVGGENGTLIDSTEIYDPASKTFAFGPKLKIARAGHSATLLENGDVLIAGGDAAGTAELYEASSDSFRALASPMSSSRKNHSTVTLKDGRVLHVGGLDNQGKALKTAEVFDPATGIFSRVGDLRAERVSPRLRLLPDGKVQVIGGNGNNNTTLEMYNVSGYFTAEVRLPRSLVKGNSVSANSVAETVRQRGVSRTTAGTVTIRAEGEEAWVTTDLTDYPPGTTVVITGGGFLPGETINLTIIRSPETEEERQMTFTSVADELGNFTNTDFATIRDDIDASFLLTATGALSGKTAYTSFTDSPKVGSATVGAQVGTLTSGTAGSATYQITVNRGSVNGSSGAFIADLSITTVLPAGVTAAFSPDPVEFTSKDDVLTATLTLNTTAAAASGVTTFTVRAATSASDYADATGTLTIGGAPNAASVLGAIGNRNVDELATLSFTATATDTNASQTLTFSLIGAPAGASIDPSTGAFSWTPSESQGGNVFTFTVKVADNGSPVQSDEEQIQVTVAEVNQAPVLAAIGDRSVDEFAALSFSASANDDDLPANTLSYSLVGAPGGASINSSTGAFSWTPGEADGGSTFTFTVKVTDNGSPAQSDEEEIDVTVGEVNAAPTLGGIGNRSVDELVTLSFTATASDSDVPTNDLSFALINGPAGASIDPASGAFSWTPTESQGGNIFTFKVSVTDNGSPNLSDEEEISVTVNEVNQAPVLAAIGNRSASEFSELTFTASATDNDLPANGLTYSLLGAPAGATINATTGAFSWTPGEADGGNTFTFTVKVTDNGTPALSHEEQIQVTVAEINAAPVLGAIGNQTVDELANLSFTATATDSDVPANTFAFSLVNAPAGASIDPSSGAFSWTPTEAQGPGTFTFTVVVTDNGSPAESDEQQVQVTVNEVNQAPALAAIGNRSASEFSELTFTASATDNDAPANGLTYNLLGAPAGATIDATSGAFSWTPGEADGGNTFTFTVKVTDDGTPALSHEEQIQVTVAEVNAAPVLGAIGNQTVDELANLSFTASATDSDVPANTVAFSLVNAPAGASIDPASGAFSWTPTEAQGPGTFTFTVVVTDNGSPAESDEQQVQVTVNEVNQAPVLAAIGSKSASEFSELTFTASATDNDLPANGLTYSLLGAPAGATIDATSGAFSWTPGEADGGNTFTFTVKVTDDGSPALSHQEQIQVTVAEANAAPVLGLIGNRTVDELANLSFTATASDSDLPANTFTFSLENGPAGASINPATGAFSWMPTEAQGPGTYTFTVRVTDDGSPAESDTEAIQVTVNEVNIAPQLASITDKTVDEGSLLSVTAVGSDADLPEQNLVYSLTVSPAGASINGSTGEFTWTPSELQGPGDYPVTVQVSDGLAAVTTSFSIHVNEVNAAPVLGSIGNKTVDELANLSFTATATDSDLPANSVSFSLVGAPQGASIDPVSGAFSWTPTEAQGPGTFTFTVKATDDGAPAESDEETIQVTVGEVNVAPELAAIGNQTVDELALLSVTAAGSDVDLPAQTLVYSLTAAPSGASIDPGTGQFSWTPSEVQGPGNYPVTVQVSDGTAAVTTSFNVQVNEVNVAPVLASIGNKSSVWGSVLSFTASASDADLPANALTFSLDPGAPAGASIDPVSGAFTWTPAAAQVGSHAITIRVTDNGSPIANDSETITVEVGRRATALVYSGDPSAQYSDPATLRATLTDVLAAAGIPSKTISFTIGTQSGSGTTNGSGLATSSITLNQAPAVSTVQSSFAGDAAYLPASDSDQFTITREDAAVIFTGSNFVQTISPSSGNATVTLSATIQDITAAGGDSYPGDIRNAKVTFVNRDAANAPISPACKDLTVSLVNPGDLKTGTVVCNWGLSISGDSADYTVGIVVNNYYTRDHGTDNEVITVSRPLTTDFITGGGYLTLQRAAGTNAGDVGSKNNFGFNVKYNKSGKNLQGSINTIIRKGGRVYQVKGNSMTSLTANKSVSTALKATFNGKASIQDVTNPLAPIALGGNATLQVVMTDRGEPGRTDSIAITVWESSGSLFFASSWDGTKTAEQELQGGNLVVR